MDIGILVAKHRQMTRGDMNTFIIVTMIYDIIDDLIDLPLRNLRNISEIR